MVDGETSSAASSEEFVIELPEELKDRLYEFPGSQGRPSIKIVFHGSLMLKKYVQQFFKDRVEEEWVKDRVKDRGKDWEKGCERRCLWLQTLHECRQFLLIHEVGGYVRMFTKPRIILFFYLFGYVDRGGTKTYSPGSFEFRATYVSLLLFRGSYVWIKFRNRGGNKAREGYSHLRKKSPACTEPRWEPRYSPLGKGRLSLGQYAEKDDAEVVLHVAQYYFERRKLKVILRDCFEYSIPDTIVPEDHGNFEEKSIRVRSKVREVLQHYKREKKKYELGIRADESPHNSPNLQNEDIAAEQQRHAFETQLLLEEENFNLKVQIAEYDFSRERLIQHLRSDNAELESMLGQFKTTHECSRNRGFE